jgi:hypothetical protein
MRRPAIDIALGIAFAAAAGACGGDDASSAAPGIDAGGARADADVSVGDSGSANDASSASDASAGVDAPSDASTADAGFFGSSRCATANVLFCEDFETPGDGGTIPARWQPTTTGSSTIAIDSAKAARGSRSAHFHIVVPQGQSYVHAMLTEKATFPQLASHVFGRVFMFLDQMPSDGVHWTMIEGQGRLPGQTFDAKYRYGGMFHKLMANYETTGGPHTDFATSSATIMPTGRWSCFEWEYEKSTDTMHLWLDETALADMTVVNHVKTDTANVWNAPDFAGMNLGWEHYQVSTVLDFNLWLDEVAIDGARIGCSR